MVATTTMLLLSIGLSILAAKLLQKKNKALAQDDKQTTLATRGSYIPRVIGRRRVGAVWAPSAELRPNQTDQDTLPPYELLDQIIERHVEREQSTRQIIEETDLDPDLVRQIARMIDRAQYKRDQAAVVLKVTDRAFGPGRPMPIAMRWEEATRPAGTPADQRAARRNR